MVLHGFAQGLILTQRQETKIVLKAGLADPAS